MNQNLPTILEAARQLPPGERRQLAELLLKEIDEVEGEQAAVDDVSEGWQLWSKIGNDAGEGKWKDASEQHDEYIYHDSHS